MSAVPVHTSTVASVEIDGEVLLFDGETLHHLNAAAAAVYRAIDGVRLPAELVEVAPGLRGVGPEQVEGVLAQLHAVGAIDLVVPPSGARYSVPDHVARVQDRDTVVLAHLGTGRRTTLGGTAAEVWARVLELGGEDDVVASLQADFPDAVDLRADVGRLLSELVEHGLLERRPAG